MSCGGCSCMEAMGSEPGLAQRKGPASFLLPTTHPSSLEGIRGPGGLGLWTRPAPAQPRSGPPSPPGPEPCTAAPRGLDFSAVPPAALPQEHLTAPGAPGCSPNRPERARVHTAPGSRGCVQSGHSGKGEEGHVAGTSESRGQMGSWGAGTAPGRSPQEVPPPRRALPARTTPARPCQVAGSGSGDPGRKGTRRPSLVHAFVSRSGLGAASWRHPSRMGAPEPAPAGPLRPLVA